MQGFSNIFLWRTGTRSLPSVLETDKKYPKLTYASPNSKPSYDYKIAKEIYLF